MSMFLGNSVHGSEMSDAERIENSAESVESKVYAGKRLAKFFELDITIKIFGNVIWSWHFPPEK